MSRDPSYFDALARLLHLERQAERERIEIDRKTLPLAELEARGLVLLDVESTESAVGLGGRSLVTFSRPQSRASSARLGPGDLVTVSPRKAEVEEPPAGTVVRCTRAELQVAFEQPPPEWVHEGRLRVDLVSNEVTWKRTSAALEAWKSMDAGVKRDRREILLGNQPPRFDVTRMPVRPSRPLNPEQLEAVALSLSARDFALVHGPPGTGKSTVLSEIAVQAVAQGQRVVCTAASNAAVDHLLELCVNAGLRAVRVGHPARVLPHLQEHTLDLLVEEHPDRRAARELFEEAFDLLGYARKQRARGRSRERFSNARAASGDARKLMDEARALERRAMAAVLGRAEVMCATCSMLQGSVLSAQSFDLVLMDEATQTIEPLALIAWLKGPKVILAGDPQQLAPTVISPEAQQKGLGVSLFERLLADNGETPKRMLKEQYRMHASIMEVPSAQMYGGQLRAHASVAGHTLHELVPSLPDADVGPVIFLDTAGRGYEESRAPGTESLVNEGEAELVVRHAKRLLAAGLTPGQLAIISPYRAQTVLLREALLDVEGLEIDTVDAFQGREKEAVLVSLVRSNVDQALGFLEDVRRMNVAMTRARRHLFVVGDSATLSGHAFYLRFQESATRLGGYRSVWEWEPGTCDPA
jgi:superfamily I DNA and/or RNA helicase